MQIGGRRGLGGGGVHAASKQSCVLSEPLTESLCSVKQLLTRHSMRSSSGRSVGQMEGQCWEQRADMLKHRGWCHC